jgi:hypothetical protein
MLSEKKRERLAEKASQLPELVVTQPLDKGWKCCKCTETSDLLTMTEGGPSCLPCAGLGDLEYLSAGNALLTGSVKARSPRHAAVLRFSRSRNRYERLGLLVEPQALRKVTRELGEQSPAQGHVIQSPRYR